MTCGIISIKVASSVLYVKLDFQNLFLEVLNFGSAWSIERFLYELCFSFSTLFFFFIQLYSKQFLLKLARKCLQWHLRSSFTP